MTACHLPTQWMPIVRICARSIRCARTMVLMPRSGFPSARRIRARATIHPRAVSPSPPGRLLPLAVRAQPLHESSPTVDTALVRTSARGAAPTTQPPTWTCRLSIVPFRSSPFGFGAMPRQRQSNRTSQASITVRFMRPETEVPDVIGQRLTLLSHGPTGSIHTFAARTRCRTDGADPRG